MYRVAAYSNIGLRKQVNEDSSFAEVATTPYGDIALCCVCDGVGGLSAGELASCSVVRWLVDWFETRCPILLDDKAHDLEAFLDAVQAEWEEGSLEVNDSLRSYGREKGTRLGTTLTAMLVFRGRYLIIHVGDTRVYRFVDGAMEQLTDDQTWVNRELARGAITQAQARNHPRKNVILQSVGTQRELQPVFLRGDDRVGATYLICCDGYRNELFDDEIQTAYAALQDADENKLYETCEALADLVMGRRELDNISAVVLSHQEGDHYPETELSDALEHLQAASLASMGMGDASVSAETTTSMPVITPDTEKVTGGGSLDDTPTSLLETPDDITGLLDDEDSPKAGA